MLHEIHPRVFDNAWKPCLLADGDRVLCYGKGGILLTADTTLPQAGMLGGAAALWRQEDPTYLFSIDDERFFLIEPREAPPTMGHQPLAEARQKLPQDQAFAATTGEQLHRWYSNNRICGRCGGPTRRSEVERALCCDCGNVIYPKISPAIIVAVSDGRRLLMTRNVRSAYKRYGLVAGFVEIGESFEQAVVREVQEEVGLRVKNVRYYKSQPWGVSDSEMIGFFADLDGDDTITVQESELSEAVWFTREEIPTPVSTHSIAQELIEAVRGRLGERAST
ncbi:MAG: NAD(+) diphosphatase [Clostridiales bacterium]|nr:NAD(+) diphosphatase [Clostridiales bacterium]